MRDLCVAETRHICEVEGCGRSAPYGRYWTDCEAQIEAYAAWEGRKRSWWAEPYMAAVLLTMGCLALAALWKLARQ